MIFLTYIAIYVPLVITPELRFHITHSTYRDVDFNTRIALGLGYGLHNVCLPLPNQDFISHFLLQAFIGLYGIILMIFVVGYQKLKFLLPFNAFMFCGIFTFIFCYYYFESVSYFSLVTLILVDYS